MNCQLQLKNKNQRMRSLDQGQGNQVTALSPILFNYYVLNHENDSVFRLQLGIISLFHCLYLCYHVCTQLWPHLFHEPQMLPDTDAFVACPDTVTVSVVVRHGRKFHTSGSKRKDELFSIFVFWLQFGQQLCLTLAGSAFVSFFSAAV